MREFILYTLTATLGACVGVIAALLWVMVHPAPCSNWACHYSRRTGARG